MACCPSLVEPLTGRGHGRFPPEVHGKPALLSTCLFFCDRASITTTFHFIKRSGKHILPYHAVRPEFFSAFLSEMPSCSAPVRGKDIPGRTAGPMKLFPQPLPCRRCSARVPCPAAAESAGGWNGWGLQHAASCLPDPAFRARTSRAAARAARHLAVRAFAR